MAKFEELLKTEQGDLLIPLRKETGKAALFRVANSDTFMIAELEKPKNQFDTEAVLKNGENWQQRARFIEGTQKAHDTFDKIIGKKIDSESINEKYR